MFNIKIIIINNNNNFEMANTIFDNYEFNILLDLYQETIEDNIISICKDTIEDGKYDIVTRSFANTHTNAIYLLEHGLCINIQIEPEYNKYTAAMYLHTFEDEKRKWVLHYPFIHDINTARMIKTEVNNMIYTQYVNCGNLTTTNILTVDKMIVQWSEMTEIVTEILNGIYGVNPVEMGIKRAGDL